VPIDARTLFSATLFGLSMFATFFLATVLAIFFTHAVVRGDMERGLLQPLVVRPVGRTAVLAGRFAAAALACAVYVAVVYAAAMLITHAVTGWWPDRIVQPALELAAAMAIIVALSLLGSIFLSALANGIAIFMLFGAGLVAGLLGQIGEALGSESLKTIANVSSWALPFEALYQDALNAITSETEGFTRAALTLGPFGGAQAAGGWLVPYILGYLALVAFAGIYGFRRKDL
jgi:ABC-type transport system involved in multi-copper enzyme maturation permease subunit